jgi:hypothetical protein
MSAGSVAVFMTPLFKLRISLPSIVRAQARARTSRPKLKIRVCSIRSVNRRKSAWSGYGYAKSRVQATETATFCAWHGEPGGEVSAFRIPELIYTRTG